MFASPVLRNWERGLCFYGVREYCNNILFIRGKDILSCCVGGGGGGVYYLYNSSFYTPCSTNDPQFIEIDYCQNSFHH